MQGKLTLRNGFTLVEVMIVVATVSLLATIAVPNFLKARVSAQNGRYVVDLRAACGAFMTFAIENNRYPADTTPGIVPTGMADYLSRMNWTGETSLGGRWDWDYQQFGCRAGVSVYQPTAPVSQLQKIDQLIDDGNLGSGSFRSRASGYISIIE